MDNIQDIDAYFSGMSATLRDKCWWLNKIPDEIDTIVDYGCAQGDLAIMIDQMASGRFKYIGIDNSPEMLALARHNHHLHFAKRDSEFYSELSGIKQKCDTSKSILVLNSVMHEFFSYLHEAERKALLAEMFGAGFAFVAIRDMYMPESNDTFDVKQAIKKIHDSPYSDMWKEYNSCIDNFTCKGNRPICWYRDAFLRVAEFLMKYRYISNWRREMNETYFWAWLYDISSEISLYRYTYLEDFHIQFITDRVKEDFGIDFSFDTHRKILLAR